MSNTLKNKKTNHHVPFDASRQLNVTFVQLVRCKLSDVWESSVLHVSRNGLFELIEAEWRIYVSELNIIGSTNGLAP